MTNADAACELEWEETEDPTDHLADIEDGCGCTEIWEHLSEMREADSK